MKKLSDLQYLKLTKPQQFWYNLEMFICAIPLFFWNLLKAIGNFFVKCGLGIKDFVCDIGYTFAKGNWAVKLSFLIFGMGNLFYGQILRGVLFLLFEIVFLAYMFVPVPGMESGIGTYWLQKGQWFQYGATVGTEQGYMDKVEVIPGFGGVDTWIPGDDSVKVLLYGLLTIIFIVAFVWTWRLQVKQCRICMDITASGRKVKSGKDDLKSLVDDQFHKTLLALPVAGIVFFTVLPLIYMVLIAFTNYDFNHDGYANLFSWVGLDNFNNMFSGEGVDDVQMRTTFGEILSWTLIWAFFATFSNYFLGMFVALMINKKGIRLKKFWRTVLVMTIAIPQFVSLLYVAKLFDGSGIVGSLLDKIPSVHQFLDENNYVSLWSDPLISRILVIVINIWIGIPHIMLMATGILMNIPQDMYESSRIDGATAMQQYTKITLPYMLFVTGPYLLTSFVGNLNNFNVIYLLSGGGPSKGLAGGATVGYTDLLITWLYKMTVDTAEQKYYLGSIIGILVFLVVAVLSLVVYNIIPSTKSEEDFQ